MKTNLQKWEEIWAEKKAKDGFPRFTDLGELLKKSQKCDRLMKRIFVHNKKRNTFTINATYAYEISLDRIPTPLALLHWAWHLCEKNWMPQTFVRQFIGRVSDIKGWDVRSSKCEKA
jgi:hypothetical protein